MRRINHTALSSLAAALVIAGTAAFHPGTAGAFPRVGTTDGAPVELADRSGSPADHLARQLLAREMSRAHARREKPLVLVGMARVNDLDEMLFVQLQSPSECGSAGCNTVSFKNVNGRWVRAMDTVGGTVRIAPTHHRGMPDMLVDGNRLVWDGTRYKDVG